MGAVVRVYRVVNGVLGQFRVNLAGFAVQAQAAVVVDAVGDVGRLLDLCDEAAAADGVDASGGQEEHVSGMHVIAGQHIGDGAVGHFGGVLFRGNLLGEAGQQVGSLIGRYHIPHLGLSLGAVVALGGQFVVGMHLDGEVREGVDELDQEGEFVPGVGIHVLSHQLSLVFFYQFGYGLALEGTFGHYALVAGHAGEFPAFANVLLVGFYAFVRGNLFTTPYNGLEDRFKFQRSHMLLLSHYKF